MLNYLSNEAEPGVKNLFLGHAERSQVDASINATLLRG